MRAVAAGIELLSQGDGGGQPGQRGGNGGGAAQVVVGVGVLGKGVGHFGQLAGDVVGPVDGVDDRFVVGGVEPMFGGQPMEVVVFVLGIAVIPVDLLSEVADGVVAKEAGVFQFVGFFDDAVEIVVQPSGGVAFGESDETSGCTTTPFGNTLNVRFFNLPPRWLAHPRV